MRNPYHEARENLMETLSSYSEGITHPESFKELTVIIEYLKWSDWYIENLIVQQRESKGLIQAFFDEDEKQLLLDKLDLRTSVSRTCAEADSVILEAMNILGKPKEEINQYNRLNKATYAIIKRLTTAG